jgi:hypothetical protein
MGIFPPPHRTMGKWVYEILTIMLGLERIYGKMVSICNIPIVDIPKEKAPPPYEVEGCIPI